MRPRYIGIILGILFAIISLVFLRGGIFEIYIIAGFFEMFFAHFPYRIAQSSGLQGFSRVVFVAIYFFAIWTLSGFLFEVKNQKLSLWAKIIGGAIIVLNTLLSFAFFWSNFPGFSLSLFLQGF